VHFRATIVQRRAPSKLFGFSTVDRRKLNRFETFHFFDIKVLPSRHFLKAASSTHSAGLRKLYYFIHNMKKSSLDVDFGQKTIKNYDQFQTAFGRFGLAIQSSDSASSSHSAGRRKLYILHSMESSMRVSEDFSRHLARKRERT